MNLAQIRSMSTNEMKSLITANRERIMIWFLIAAAVFFLFYWTSMGIGAAVESRREAADAARQQIARASELAASIKAKGSKTRNIQGGVLSFVQEAAGTLNISDKVASLKPVSRPTGQETVSVRLENITLTELVSFTRQVERYDNLAVLNFSLTRRFDNAERANATYEIMKR